MADKNQKRVIVAPQPISVSPASLPTNRVLSVELAAGEDVEWVWSSLPDGTRYVSGYTVLQTD